MSIPLRNVRVSESLDQYIPFFDIKGTVFEDSYSLHQSGSSKWHSKLQTVVFDLLFGWKSTSALFASPYHLAGLSANSLEFGFNAKDPESIRDMDVFMKHFLKGLNGKVDSHCRRIVKSRLKEIRRRLDEVRKSDVVKTKVTAEDIWQRGLIADPLYKSTLPELQKVCFVNLYVHYESFFVHSLKILTSDKINVSDKDKRKGFDVVAGRLLGSTKNEGLFYEIYYSYWIRFSRAIRNSVTHAGGRMTKELQQFQKDLELVDDHVQILPGHVRTLFNLLRPAAERLAVFVQSRLECEATMTQS